MDEHSIAVRVPRPEFTDTELRGAKVGPRESNVPVFRVVPWAPARVRRYHHQLHRWEQFAWGRKLLDLAGVARRRGGVLGWVLRWLDVPYVRPSDRTCLVSDCLFEGAGVTL